MTTATTTHADDFRFNADGSLVCIHRDLSCCEDCANAHDEVTNVVGAHYWIADPAERTLFV